MDSERQQLLDALYQEAKKKILTSPQDFVWTEDELGFAVFNTYQGPERNEPTEPECRKMARAILQLKPSGLDLRTKSEEEGTDESEESSDLTTNRIDTDQEPDLYVPDSEFPDYGTNWDGTVICLGGARKKKGKRMRPEPRWVQTKGGKWYPQSFFRLTRGDGTRHLQTQAQMLMRRLQTILAQKPKPEKSEEVVGETA